MSSLKGKVTVHPMVWKTAVGMAHELYEQLMSDNRRYAEWKAKCPDLTPQRLEKLFVSMLAPKLLLQARATLAKMLTEPYDEALKDEIAEALIADRGLVRGRGRHQLTWH